MKVHFKMHGSFAAIALACVSQPIWAAAPDAVEAAVIVTQNGAPAAPKPLFSRWLDLDALSHSERFRSSFVTGGGHIWEGAQQRNLIEGKVKLDEEGRYAIGFRASSGRYFNWAFASYTGPSAIKRVSNPAFQKYYTPAERAEVIPAYKADPTGVKTLGGLQSNGWQFYMRELYFSATPVKPLTVQFGSMGIERGVSTEVTTFDDDGYISGERVRLHDPKHLFFDEVSFTDAYFGDIGTPNLFARGGSLGKWNYRQLAAKKVLNDRIAFSGEYTWQLGTDTLRQGVVIHAKELKVLEGVRLEAYERVNTTNLQGLPVSGGAGFALAALEKKGKFTGDFGFASIDSDYSVYAGSRYFHANGFALNADTLSSDKHPFVHASYKLTPELSAVGYYTHGVGSGPQDLNQQTITGGMSLDLKALVNREKLVF